MHHTNRPIKTRFRCAYTYRLKLAWYTKSLTHYTKGTRSALRPPTVCRHMVSVLFHSPHGVLFTFPSRYLFTIGRQKYLALEGGPPRFRQDFTCPVVLRNQSKSQPFFAYGAFTLYSQPFQDCSAKCLVCNFSESHGDNPQLTL